MSWGREFRRRSVGSGRDRGAATGVLLELGMRLKEDLEEQRKR